MSNFRRRKGNMFYHCNECGREEEYDNAGTACDNGWWYDDDSGEWYCGDCWNCCEDCEENYLNSELFYIESEDKSVCEDCFHENYRECAYCDWRGKKENFYEVNFIDDYGQRMGAIFMCEDCTNRFAHSDEYGNFFINQSEYQNLTRSGSRTNMDGHILQENLVPNFVAHCADCTELGRQCPKCMKKEAENFIKEETNLWVYDTVCRSYHDSIHKKFKTTKYRFEHEHPYLYYGIELEVLFDDQTNVQKIAREYIKATGGLFVAEFDRSVTNNGNGCEFISRPLSYKKWMSKETIQLLEEGKKVLQKYKAYSPQPNSCGLHVHMSLRFFEQNTTKKVSTIKSDIDWMFQIFQPEMEKISQRQYTRYCASKASRLKQALRDNPYAFNLSSSIILEKGNLTQSLGSGDTHHDAIIQTNKTIEVRTFNSTIETEEILATIEFCRAIAHAARNMEMTNETTLGDILYCKDSNYLEPFIKKTKVDTKKKFTNKLEVQING